MLLFVWFTPALYLMVVKGYGYHDHGLFYSNREQRKWIKSVLNAGEIAKLAQKYQGLTEEECREYLDYLLDSLDNNKPTIVYIPFYDF